MLIKVSRKLSIASPSSDNFICSECTSIPGGSIASEMCEPVGVVPAEARNQAPEGWQMNHYGRGKKTDSFVE